ncbi:GntR family transcriptional regulator [Streptomyces sp. NPDC003717]|uniref:GntR family transcriptional regulator n=1 Tax=Streptomyces sp. NPDC003717 TaxID=3154276 RepID=UPI0033B08869
MPNHTRPSSGERARQHALGRLRQAILRGEMAPAQRLVENELAERYGVTRASVRAALIDLESQGLVERVRNRGSRVRVVGVEEAVSLTECRLVLEGLCAARAAAAVDDEQAAELADLGAAMRRTVADGDPLAYAELAHRLHHRIRELSGQFTAMELLERLDAQLVRQLLRLAFRPGRTRRSLDEHLAVIEAVTARDPQAAESAVRAHLTSVIEALRAG